MFESAIKRIAQNGAEHLRPGRRAAQEVAGNAERRLVAGLSMPDWPEGARRAINVTLGPIVGLTAPMFRPLESALDAWREADGLAFDYEGD